MKPILFNTEMVRAIIELSLDEYHKGLTPEELKKKFNNRGVV